MMKMSFLQQKQRPVFDKSLLLFLHKNRASGEAPCNLFG